MRWIPQLRVEANGAAAAPKFEPGDAMRRMIVDQLQAEKVDEAVTGVHQGGRKSELATPDGGNGLHQAIVEPPAFPAEEVHRGADRSAALMYGGMRSGHP